LVLTQFAKEVRAYRKRSAKARTALIVVIDADTLTVQARLRQLAQALEEREAAAVRKPEQIAQLVPKRNVETWILCLTGEVVDEATDYKRTRDNWNALIPVASETLFAWTRPNVELPQRCTASLRAGISQLNRLAL
jgi:hypothetical protein